MQFIKSVYAWLHKYMHLPKPSICTLKCVSIYVNYTSLRLILKNKLKVYLALIQTNAFSLLVCRHMKEKKRVCGELAIMCSVKLYSKQVTTQSKDWPGKVPATATAPYKCPSYNRFCKDTRHSAVWQKLKGEPWLLFPGWLSSCDIWPRSHRSSI